MDGLGLSIHVLALFLPLGIAVHRVSRSSGT
jgi:hypothetical protein